MKLMIIMCCLILAGCVTTPVAREFPNIPPALKQKCGELILVPLGTTKLSDVITVVTENYAQYNGCKALNDAWSAWYAEQKIIFESVK
jgi:hypothetical protein